jgi:hypothetical protein
MIFPQGTAESLPGQSHCTGEPVRQCAGSLFYLPVWTAFVLYSGQIKFNKQYIETTVKPCKV